MSVPEQAKFQVHHVRFYQHQPQTVNCISSDDLTDRVAVSRSDASVEILSSKDNWCKEMVFPGNKEASVEALVWCKGRLFAGGLGGNVVELDLTTQLAKNSVSSNAGPIWCLTKNSQGDQIAAGTEDGCVVLFDVTDELQFLRGFGKQEGRILSIAWYYQEDENIIVTGGINNIRQWSVKSGQPISRMTLGRKFQSDTIVWCITVTNDFTIISGDSRGVVTFWNGKESTQLKAFHCHKADVLTLCLSDDESRVFSGGIDAALYQFTRYTADPITERKRWVNQLLHNRHSHDIRALAYINGFLASGGVDPTLYVAKLKGRQSVLEVAPVPSPGLIHVAKEKNLIQLQYSDCIEVWRLGAANTPFAEARGMLPLIQKRIKLLQLKARAGHEILCSAISDDGHIAFSDSKGVRVFQLNLENETSSAPAVSLEPRRTGFAHPARLMTFTPAGNKLVTVLTTGVIQMMDMGTGHLTQTLKNISTSPIHRLAASPRGQFMATATLDHGVHVYDVDTGQHVCSCPVQDSQVSAIAFSPHSPVLVIAYSNHLLYEFDLEKKEYSSWCRETSSHFPKNWLKPLRSISHVAFNPDLPHQIVLHTDSALCVLDKTKKLNKPEGKQHGHGAHLMESVSRICYKYKYLLHADFTSNGMLVVVERPPSEIEDNLPPSFKQKKFGVS